MPEDQDPILQEQMSLGVPATSPYDAGLYILKLTPEQIGKHGSFIADFYKKLEAQYKRQVTRTGLTMLQGAIFAVGTRDLKNPEWKEHCASSLREIFHEWRRNGDLSYDFNLCYRAKGSKLDPAESEVFKVFKLHYDYFCGIDHHEVSGITSSMRSLRNDESLKPEHCLKDDVFLETVQSFFSILSQINEFPRVSEQS